MMGVYFIPYLFPPHFRIIRKQCSILGSLPLGLCFCPPPMLLSPNKQGQTVGFECPACGRRPLAGSQPDLALLCSRLAGLLGYPGVTRGSDSTLVD